LNVRRVANLLVRVPASRLAIVPTGGSHAA
jgi:hypothetical protein